MTADDPIDWRARALAAEVALDNAYLAFAALVAECYDVEAFAGRAVGRSVEHLAAIRGRDRAIDALTRRVAELMPCQDQIACIDDAKLAARLSEFECRQEHQVHAAPDQQTCDTPHRGDCEFAVWSDGPRMCVRAVQERIEPTTANCKQLGANHDEMTAENTQSEFGHSSKKTIDEENQATCES